MTGYSVESSVPRYDGPVFSVRTDTVQMPSGRAADRDVVAHPGAVGVVALDADERVLLIRQYRHPVGDYLWELPAGLRDVEGEPAVDTARRELLEEAGLEAPEWHLLASYLSSPGFTDESVSVYLARGAVPSAAARAEPEHEEADLTARWLPLDDAVAGVRSGELRNAMAVVGVLAAAEARRSGYAGLSPA